MRHRLMQAFGIVAATLLALGAGSALADAVGPYYATPSWDQTLPANTRFIVLSNMNGDAVLDRETGLVWEKSPSTSTSSWFDAQLYCNILSKGNRLGWRLPTLQELASLADPSVAPPGPTLPAGHPFQHVQSGIYWSATTAAGLAGYMWGVSFQYGSFAQGNGADSLFFSWCVRGGQGVDSQ